MSLTVQNAIYANPGFAGGNFSPKTIDDSLVKKLETIKKEHSLQKIISPRCGLTNLITTYPSEEYAPPLPAHPYFFRSKNVTDGVIVKNPWEGVVIFNADCPIVVISDLTYESRRMAVLHAGLPCLLPSKTDTNTKDTRSIISVCFEDFNFSIHRSRVFASYGIGPCCYGIGERENILHDPQFKSMLGKATRGPRMGQPSLDLYELIYAQLIDIGIPPQHIVMKKTCTSCAFEYGRPLYHSHIRPDNNGARNASIFWLKLDF